MTWRWRTCFSSAVLAALTISGRSAPAGTVAGQIRLVDSGVSTVKRQSDYSGVVVWLETSDPEGAAAVRKHAYMQQKNKMFSPHILVVPAGSVVDFPNLDPIFHNAFSNFEGQIFDVSLYPPGTSRAIRFSRPGIVRVFCNIHPSMSAIIVVVDSNKYAVTDRDGGFRIRDVAAGSYEMHVYHERATAETLARLSQRLTVGEQGQVLTRMTISEAGYLPVAHKNKYGRDYLPDREERQYAWPPK